MTRLSVAIRVWPSACVPRMSASANALGERARQAGLLVDLDHASRRSSRARSGWFSRTHACGVGGVGGDDQDGVRGARARRSARRRSLRPARRERGEVERAGRRAAASACRSRPARDRGRRRRRRCPRAIARRTRQQPTRPRPSAAETVVPTWRGPGRVENELRSSPEAQGRDRRRRRRCRAPTVGHLHEHRRTAARRAAARARATCRRGRRSRTCSEPRQVLADLPLGDLLVVAEPLVALDLRVVVDVVLVAAPAERRAQRVVGLELADRLEQVRGQRLAGRGR